VTLPGQLPFPTDEARNGAVTGLTVVFSGGNGAAVSVLREGVGSATEGADNEVGGAAAAVDIVTEAVATGTL